MVGDGELGTRLRQARRERGLSLRSVAGRAGISASLLSQVENGKTQPSVSTLYSIVTHLEISIDKLLGNEPRGGADQESAQVANKAIQRGPDNPRIQMQHGVVWERLAVGDFTHVDPLLTTYAPGGSGSVNGNFMRHAGVEYGYIIEGALTLKLEFETILLHAGDSLCFDSSRPHLYVNESDEPAKGLWYVFDRGDGKADGLLTETQQLPWAPLTS